MKTTFLLFCSFCIVAFIGCSKSSGPSTVKGTVVDNISGKPVANATVFLVQLGQSIGAAGQQLQTTTSDANGYFIINFNFNEGTTYYIQANALNFEQNDGSNIVYVRNVGTSNVTIRLTPYGCIGFHLVKTSSNNSVSIDIETDYGYSLGTKSDTTVYTAVHGNKGNRFYYWVETFNSNGGGPRNRYSDSIYVPELDTVYYTIKW